MIRRRLQYIVLALLILFLAGTAGYSLIEGWSPLDAAYMTVTTLTTVGFGEVFPLSRAGKYFTIVLILCGVGTFAYAFSSMYALLLSDDVRHHLLTLKRNRMAEKLERHVIVCGFGRMGRHVAIQLKQEEIPFVIVEKDEARAHEAEERGYVALHGDAAEDQLLKQAGIERARALITTVDTDAENVFVVVTARALRPTLQIVSRANREASMPKLKRAGADRVILPYAISGQRMVGLVSRPAVSDFLDLVMHSADLELRLEEMIIPDSSAVAGLTLADVKARQDYGVTILAIVPSGRPALTAPQAPDRLEAGSRLIALGTKDALEKFANRVNAP